MKQRHWTNEELLDHVYGVGPEDGHELDCAECQARISGLKARRADLAAEPWIPIEFLRVQREAIAERIEGGASRKATWWGPPAWAAVMIALAFALSWPAPPREKTIAGGAGGGGDAGMYMEIYQTISTEEPRALAPMHALFEE